jgi:hypothetical protein
MQTAALAEQLGTGSHALGVINPAATGAPQAFERVITAANRLTLPGGSCRISYDRPTARGLRDMIGATQTTVIGSGGDGSVNELIAAMVGVVPDDPEATARNFETHEALLSHIRYVSLAGGRANNWPLSALGDYAAHPERIGPTTDLRVGMHRPIVYEVLGKTGAVKRLGVATSCVGVQGTEKAAHDLGAAKPWLKRLRPFNHHHRSLHEANIAFQAILKSPPFSAEVSLVSPTNTHEFTLANRSGVEFVGTEKYASHGRTKTHVDDTFWQPLSTHRTPNIATELEQLADASLRLLTGQHAIRPLDLDKTEVWIRLTSKEPVFFHVDAETDRGRNVLNQGEQLRLRLAQLAVPTVVAR